MSDRVRASVESLRFALRAIPANPARGVLTTVGIVVGIPAASTTMTAANGLANAFRESASVIGTDVLFVSRTPWIITGRFFQYRNRPNLELKEAAKLDHRLGTALAVNPTTDTERPVRPAPESH